MDDLKHILKEMNLDELEYSDYTDQNTEVNTLNTKTEFEQYLTASEVLTEFGFEGNVDAYLGINYFKHHLGTPGFRNKCLVLENFKQLDYAFSHPFTFNYSEKRLYALASLYKALSIEQQEIPAFLTFMQIDSEARKRRYGYSNEEMEEKYPLTAQKLQMMERIHNTKKNAKNKSGGVSL